MAKITGFMEFDRREGTTEAPTARIRNFKEFKHLPDLEEQQKQETTHIAWCTSGRQINVG